MFLAGSQGKTEIMGDANSYCMYGRALNSEGTSLVSTHKSLVWTLGKLRESIGFTLPIYKMGLTIGCFHSC